MTKTDGQHAPADVESDLPRAGTIEARDADTLVRVMEALDGSDVLRDGISRVMDICCSVAGADLVALLRQNGDGEMVTVAASDTGFGLPRWQIPVGEMRALGRVADLGTTSLHARMPRPARRYHSLVSVPVECGQQSQSVLVALKADADHYSPQDATLLARIAKHLGRVLQCQRASDRVAALEAIFAGDEIAPPPAAGLDPSFDALSRAFNRLEWWQSRVLQMTDDLLSAPSDDVDAAIDRALATLGQLSDSDRTYVFRLRAPSRLDNTHEWVAPGIKPMIGILQDLDDSVMDEWLLNFSAGMPVYIADVDELPETSVVRDVLRAQGIRSLLSVPMLREGKISGFIGYDAVRERRRFLPVELQLLLSVANTINAVMDRKAAEAAAHKAALELAAESGRLRATLAAVPDLILTVDSEGRFTGYNFGSAATPLYSPQDFIGKLVEEVLPPNVAQLARSTMRELDETETSNSHDYSMPTPTGERWYSSSAGALRNGNERSGYVFLVRDITERHDQDRRIRQLSRIAELTSNLVIVTDPDGRIDWVNPAFEARSGWKLDEVRGKKPGDFLQFEGTDSDSVVEIRDLLTREEPVRTELLNRSRTGEEYWVMKDIQPLRDAKGRLEGFVSIQTDITQMKTSHHRDQQLRNTAIETASDGIAISSYGGQFLYMNPAHRAMFGIGPDEDVRSFTHDDLMAAGQKEELARTSLPVLLADGRWRGPIIGRHRDGHDLELDITTTVIENRDMVSVVRDVSASKRAETERARLREDLHLAQRRETAAHVASGVAHDLSNLVAVVSGTVSTLLKTPPNEADLHKGLLRIDRAMQAARDLVHGLGDLGRPDAPRISIDLRSIIVEAVDLLGTDRARRHAIHSELPAAPQMVMANRTELLQVMVNLALNACEAEGDRPNVVTLKVFTDDTPPPARAPDAGNIDTTRRYRMFSISDTGTGIPDDLRAKLFERYVTTKGARGTGLGLPIVATILRQSGGALWLDSIPGEGTTITVAWDADDARHPQTARATVDDANSADLKGLRIMVVDDNLEVADTLSEILESDGAIAVAISDPVEARALITRNPQLWSLLVTDHDMPAVTGTQLAKVAAECSPHLPCILVTALGVDNGWNPALFAAVLSKPVDPSVFLRAARRAANRRSKDTVPDS